MTLLARRDTSYTSVRVYGALASLNSCVNVGPLAGAAFVQGDGAHPEVCGTLCHQLCSVHTWHVVCHIMWHCRSLCYLMQRQQDVLLTHCTVKPVYSPAR